MKTNRKIEFDIVKGIGIILMVYAHIFTTGTIDKWIHGFHMPLFFIISGLLFKRKNDVKKSVIGKVKSIIIPYLFFAFFHLAIFGLKEIMTTKSLSNTLIFIKKHPN